MRTTKGLRKKWRTTNGSIETVAAGIRTKSGSPKKGMPQNLAPIVPSCEKCIKKRETCWTESSEVVRVWVADAVAAWLLDVNAEEQRLPDVLHPPNDHDDAAGGSVGPPAK